MKEIVWSDQEILNPPTEKAHLANVYNHRGANDHWCNLKKEMPTHITRPRKEDSISKIHSSQIFQLLNKLEIVQYFKKKGRISTPNFNNWERDCTRKRIHCRSICDDEFAIQYDNLQSQSSIYSVIIYIQNFIFVLGFINVQYFIYYCFI